MNYSLPERCLQIRSTLATNGVLEIELVEASIVSPGDDQVVVRIDACPINPSDLISLLAGANPVQAEFLGTPEYPKVIARFSPEAVHAHAGRIGQSLSVGLEGAGTVIAAGKNAQDLLGKRVAMLSLARGMFAQYCTVSKMECLPLPATVSNRDGAALFCNPMTALAIVETLYQEGHTALVHTAAASNLGQMLVKICQEDDVPLVNIVRSQEQVELLRRIGAKYICNSSALTFREDLIQALRDTGATVAFDAIGGGTMASQILSAIEAVAAERLINYSPYGSSERKRVYIYGRLDPSPTLLDHKGYGLIWGVDGWVNPPIMARAGAERVAALRHRVVTNIKTTFASHFSHEISLAEVLQRDVMMAYCRQTTGEKYLINPQL